MTLLRRSRPVTLTVAAVATTLVASGVAIAATNANADPAESATARAGSAKPPVIRGYVGDDDTITISKRRVPAGRYKLVIVDASTDHNWHIKGDVAKKTTVDGTGTWTWVVRLRKGTYSIVCDPHSDEMFTSIKVTKKN